jgi:hypothetical protein
MERVVMGKKLEGNGMWESSRMMLPEHRESILESNRHIKDFARPSLDEQEMVFVNEALQRSIYTKCLIKLKVYDVYQYREVTGTVVRMDYQLKQVKFDMGEEWEWIKLLDIMKAEVKEIEVWNGGGIDW